MTNKATLALTVLVACAADSAIAPTTPKATTGCVDWMTVTPSMATLFPGDTIRISAASASGPDCGRAASEWRWRSSDTTVAVVDSLNGLATAVAAGTSTIIAYDAVDPNVKGASAIVVKKRP